MSAQRKLEVPDPAGLDQVLLALGKAGTRFLETYASQKLGRPVNLWDGKDGLGAVLGEQLKAAGVPNKRLPQLLTPRAVVNAFTPIVPPFERKRKVRRLKAR